MIYRLKNSTETQTVQTVLVSQNGDHVQTIDVQTYGGVIDQTICPECETLVMTGSQVPRCCPGFSLSIIEVRLLSADTITARYRIEFEVIFDRVDDCNENQVIVGVNGQPGRLFAAGRRTLIFSESVNIQEINILAYSACTNIANIATFATPAPPCCNARIAAGLPVFISYDSGLDLATYDVPITIGQTTPAGCIAAPITLSSADFTTPITVTDSGLARIVVPKSGKTVTVFVTDSCGSTQAPFYLPISPIDCCKGNVVFTRPIELIGTSGSGDYRVWFRFDQEQGNCIPAGNQNEFTIGTLTSPGYTDGPIVVGQEVSIDMIGQNPAGGTIVVGINYGCDNDERDYTTPYPPDPQCCNATITINSITDLGVTGMLRDIEIDITITEPGGCAPGVYDVTIDGNLVLSDPAGNYLIGYQIPAPGNWAGSLVATNQCDGRTYNSNLIYATPPCCNFSVQWSTPSFIGTVGNDTQVSVVGIISNNGPGGCVDVPYFISGTYIPLQPYTSGTPLTFLVPIANRPTNAQFSITGCSEVPLTSTLPLPPGCCNIFLVVEAPKTVFFARENGYDRYGSVFTIQLISQNPLCLRQIVRFSGTGGTELLGVGNSVIPYIEQTVTFTITGNFSFRVPEGQNVASFSLIGDCTNTPQNVFIALPPLPCCDVYLNSSTSYVMYSGQISPGGRSGVRFYLDIRRTPGLCITPPGLSATITGFGTFSLILGMNTIDVADAIQVGVGTVSFPTEISYVGCAGKPPVNFNLPPLFKPNLAVNCCPMIIRGISVGGTRNVVGRPTANPNFFEQDFFVDVIAPSIAGNGGADGSCSASGVTLIPGPGANGALSVVPQFGNANGLSTTISVEFALTDLPGAVRTVQVNNLCSGALIGYIAVSKP